MVIVSSVAAWLLLVAIFDRHMKGSEAIVFTEPAPGHNAKIGANKMITWKGTNKADGECKTRNEDGTTVPIPNGAFSVRTGPYYGFGEGLGWLDVECDGEWAENYARKIERPLVQQRVEIARIGLNTKRMKTWLDENITPVIENKVKVLKGTMGSISFRTVFRHYVNVYFLDVDVRNTRLTVDEGFAIESDVKIIVRTKEVNCGFCWFSINRIELKGRISTKLAMQIQDEQIKIKVRGLNTLLKSYRTSTILPDNWEFIRSWIEDELRQAAATKNTIAKIEAKLTKWAKQEMQELNADLGPKFVKWMTKQRVIDRIRMWTSTGDFKITRGRSYLGGERLEFSISVAAPWLGRPAPALDFKAEEQASPVVVKVSYGLLNKALEVWFDRPLSVVVNETKELRNAFDEIKDELMGMRQEQYGKGLEHLTHYIRKIKPMLGYSGIEFDTRLEFKTPIVAEPNGRDKIRFALIGARIMRETRTPPKVWLSLSAEAEFGLTRETKTNEAKHMLNRILIEAVPRLGAKEYIAPRHYRSLASLITAMVRGKRTKWSKDEQVRQTALIQIQKVIEALNTTTRIKLPIRARIGTLRMEVSQLHNDQEQYAMVMSAQMQR